MFQGAKSSPKSSKMELKSDQKDNLITLIPFFGNMLRNVILNDVKIDAKKDALVSL